MTDDVPTVFFRDAAEFRAWLEQNHDTAAELWMEVRKAHVAERGLTWADAVPEALCFGWIDSVSLPIDENTRRQRWTPRKARSTWSKINIAHVERLLAEGRMHPSGIAGLRAAHRGQLGGVLVRTGRC
ncbi:MAG: YdeI/OmpD-associated family protein [Microbacterium gubbeenense]